MKNLSARRLLFIAASILSLIAVWMLLSIKSAQRLDITTFNIAVTGIVALLFIIIAIRGPLHITKNTLPQEPKRLLKLAGFSLFIVGVAFALAVTLVPLAPIIFATLPQWGLALGASSLLAIALFGQAPLAQSSPIELKAVELVGILGGSGFNKTDGIANAEMSYWTGNKTDGLPIGSPIVDVPLLDMDLTPTTLTKLCNKNGLTVLNLGSYTCPHHRRRINELLALKNKYASDTISFVTIYTAEAHPDDGWTIPGNFKQDTEYTGNDEDFCILQATTIEARRDAAKMFIDNKHFNWPVYLDTMENKALHAYNSWPIRLYLIQNGKIIFTGAQGPFGYQPDGLEKAIKGAAVSVG